MSLSHLLNSAWDNSCRSPPRGLPKWQRGRSGQDVKMTVAVVFRCRLPKRCKDGLWRCPEHVTGGPVGRPCPASCRRRRPRARSRLIPIAKTEPISIGKAEPHLPGASEARRGRHVQRRRSARDVSRAESTGVTKCGVTSGGALQMLKNSADSLLGHILYFPAMFFGFPLGGLAAALLIRRRTGSAKSTDCGDDRGLSWLRSGRLDRHLLADQHAGAS